MKGLSIEQKAKRYDEAFERVKELLSRCRTNRDRRTMVYRVEDIESIFSELKKSEDEKIKEDLIEWISDFPDMIWSGHYKKDVIAWLEKQGDTNETINKDEFAQGVLKGAAINLITWIDYNAAESNMCLSNMECKDVEDALVSGDWNKIYAYIKKKLESNEKKPQGKLALEAVKEEKIDNQTCVKPADKFKPKFKEGDWISNDMCDAHIASIEDGMYYFDEGDGLSIVFVDEHYHLWTIENAMDGDVLAVEPINDYPSPFIAIYKERGLDFFNSHCFISCDGEFHKGTTGHDIRLIHPATKEQRDILFQKMKKEGYVWDSKKKEFYGYE